MVALAREHQGKTLAITGLSDLGRHSRHRFGRVFFRGRTGPFAPSHHPQLQWDGQKVYGAAGTNGASYSIEVHYDLENGLLPSAVMPMPVTSEVCSDKRNSAACGFSLGSPFDAAHEDLQHTDKTPHPHRPLLFCAATQQSVHTGVLRRQNLEVSNHEGFCCRPGRHAEQTNCVA